MCDNNLSIKWIVYHVSLSHICMMQIHFFLNFINDINKSNENMDLINNFLVFLETFNNVLNISTK
jgi:hypothetical protein